MLRKHAQRALKSISRRMLRDAWRLGVRRSEDYLPALILGEPRSGTTWVLEVLEKGMGSRRLYEPFVQADVGGRPYWGRRFSQTDGANILQSLMRNDASDLVEWPQRIEAGQAPSAMARALLAERTLIKSVRLMRLSSFWGQLPNRAIVLFRHPASVAFSQAKQWRLMEALDRDHLIQCEEADSRSAPFFDQDLLERYPHLEVYVGKKLSVFEALLLGICTSYYVVAQETALSSNSMWVNYEDLLRDDGGFSKIASFIGGEYSPPASIQDASATTIDLPTGRDNQKWRTSITSSQKAALARVMDAFEIEVSPDTGSLNRISGHEIRRSTQSLDDSARSKAGGVLDSVQ